MKKNKMMRLASVLLVAVLLSTCAISGTFAKYVTSGDATSTARVAKFGVVVDAEGDLFKTKYVKDDTDATIRGESVISSGNADDNVVAPGTKGNLTNVKITGTPEVAVKVTNEAEVTLAGWKVPAAAPDDATEFYFPLVIKVNEKAVDLSSCTGIADVQTKIKNAIEDVSKEYEAKADLSDATNAFKLNVSWEWPFAKGADDAAKAETDRKDTALGDADTASKISIKITTTVTQID